MESTVWTSTWGNVAQIAGAIATVVAIIVALFKEDITKWFRRPSLEISIKTGPPDCNKSPVRYEIQTPTGTRRVETERYYLRLWVENKGRLRADKVQVFAARLWKRAGDGSFIQVESYLPMNLKWAHSQETFADGISPKMGKHCDLGHITRPSSRAELGEFVPGLPDDKTVLLLNLEFLPFTMTHILRPGYYRLELQLGAANCEPREVTVEIDLRGDWYDDEVKMFSDGLGLKVHEH
jgi:hypothetical protein